uniref:Uncharacterized protein n=1 Tax=Setaria digitata TaxID=48799 RepID=A0A915PQ02_9BILA
MIWMKAIESPGKIAIFCPLEGPDDSNKYSVVLRVRMFCQVRFLIILHSLRNCCNVNYPRMSSSQHTALDRKDYLNCTARTCTTGHNTQHQSTQAGQSVLGAYSPAGVHGGRASLGSIIRGTKGHLSNILGSVTQSDWPALFLHGAIWKLEDATRHIPLFSEKKIGKSTCPTSDTSCIRDIFGSCRNLVPSEQRILVLGRNTLASTVTLTLSALPFTLIGGSRLTA